MDIRESPLPSGGDPSGDKPAPPVEPSLLERLAASHAAVLEKWHRNFALDLRRPPAALSPKDVSSAKTTFHRP